MTFENKTIELCQNVEWYQNYCEGFENYDIDAADQVEALASNIWDDLWQLGYEVCSPRNGRSTVHGWNGAHMRYKYGPVGSFCEISDEEANAIELVVDAAILKCAVQASSR